MSDELAVSIELALARGEAESLRSELDTLCRVLNAAACSGLHICREGNLLTLFTRDELDPDTLLLWGRALERAILRGEEQGVE